MEHRYTPGKGILGGVMVIVLVIGSMVRVSKPGQERQTFKGDKNP
jgi:hypothetical protein